MQRSWDGIISMDFSFREDNVHVVHYRTIVDSDSFDLYVPRIILNVIAKETPKVVHATFGRSSPQPGVLGFVSLPADPKQAANCYTYEYTEKTGHKYRFDMCYMDKKYAVYIPKSLFNDLEPPKRIFVLVQLSDDRPH